MQPAVMPVMQVGDSVPLPGVTVSDPPVSFTLPWKITFPVKRTLVPFWTVKVEQFTHVFPGKVTFPLGEQLVVVAKPAGAPEAPTVAMSWSTYGGLVPSQSGIWMPWKAG